MKYARHFWMLLKQTAREWVDDKIPQLGAALAFYSILSLTPLLLIAIAIAAFAFGEEAAQGRMVEQLRDMVGDEGTDAVQTMLKHSQRPQTGIIAASLGIAALLIGATGLFGQLQDALNTVWDVPPTASGGIWGFIRTRFLSIIMVLGIGFLLLVSLVLSAALTALGDHLNRLMPGLASIYQGVNQLISFALIAILFAMIFKVLPDVNVHWRDVWFGAILTAALFTLGKFLIGFYLGKAGVGSAYGAAGSLVVLVVWIYYSAQIVLLGAEFTQVYTKHAKNIEEPV